MCLSIHLRSVTTESVDGSRFSAQVFVQGEECESTIRKVIAIPLIENFVKYVLIYKSLSLIHQQIIETAISLRNLPLMLSLHPHR